MSIAPGSAAFSMVYADSLFLVLVVLAMIAAEGRRYAGSAILYGLATLTRLPGLALGIPLLLLFHQGGARGRDMAWLALGPCAIALFSVILAGATGNPIAFLTGQASWADPTASVLPVDQGSLHANTALAWLAAPDLATSLIKGLTTATVLVHVVAAGVALWARIPVPYVAYMLV